MAPKKKTVSKKSEDVITKDMTLGDVLQKHPEVAPVMFSHGLHCIGCHISAYETVEQGAMSHGIDVKKFVEALNKAVKK